MNKESEIAQLADSLQNNITINTLFESLAEGIIVIDQRGQIVFINNKLSRLTGYSKEEALGQNMSIFLPREFHGRHSEHIKGYFQQPRMRSMGGDSDLYARRKDNSLFPVEISLSYLDVGSGKLGVGFITDISKRKEIENELKRKNAELDKYAHTIAHDINSTLSGVIGILEMLLDENKFNKEEIEDSLEVAAKSSRQMSNVVKDLLLFATMEKRAVKIVTLDTSKILDNAINRLSYVIRELGANITISNELLPSQGYAPWVEEVFYNFISNAIKYGGPSPKVSIYSERQSSGMIKYSVQDWGPGIEPELIPVLFEEKNETKDRLVKGHGLGLSITARIMDRLDGFLEVESQLGEGSTFSFFLKG